MKLMGSLVFLQRLRSNKAIHHSSLAQTADSEWRERERERERERAF